MEPGVEPLASRDRPRRSRQALTSASWTASSAAYPSRKIRLGDRVQAVVCGGREGIECLVVAPLCAFDEFGRHADPSIAVRTLCRIHRLRTPT